MGATELQSNWPEMRKTLGKPGFLSGEDRIRTIAKYYRNSQVLTLGGAKSGALTEVLENTGLSNPHMADPDLAFIIEAWPLLRPQAKSQMIAMARAAGSEGSPVVRDRSRRSRVKRGSHSDDGYRDTVKNR